MADHTPAPGSPEALAAARKVRDIFLLIAALNILLIAIIFGRKWFEKDRPAEEPKAALEAGSPSSGQ